MSSGMHCDTKTSGRTRSRFGEETEPEATRALFP